ncbi:hypothetical protein ACLOJK_018088 [Asimina triloba]
MPPVFMEESEKRKERLKALRAEAAQAQVSNTQNASTLAGSLSNPLIDPSFLPPPAENSPAAIRFDFYTDPMSAFSGNKRWNSDNIRSPHGHLSPPISSCSSVGPRNPNAIPATPHQFQMHYTPDPRAYQSPPSRMSAPWRSPMRMASPFPGHTGIPSMCNQSGGSPRFGFPPYSPRAGFASPGYGRRGSASPNTRRGSYNRFNRSPGSGQSSGRGGWSSGRGRGFHVSAWDQPERFYHKSMMEDPWQFLKPIVKSLAATAQNSNVDSQRSWLPKSISTKKARVSEPSSVDFDSKSSLADCLTLSLEEVVNDATNV